MTDDDNDNLKPLSGDSMKWLIDQWALTQEDRDVWRAKFLTQKKLQPLLWLSAWALGLGCGAVWF